MPSVPFSVLIPVRYGDLDAQGHVNNARYATFIEQARMEYLIHLGLWDGVSFDDLGLIVADVHISYRAAVRLGQTLRVIVHVTSLGNKSLRFEYRLEDAASGAHVAQAETLMVAYDYHTERSISVPQGWREQIARFEGIPERETTPP